MEIAKLFLKEPKPFTTKRDINWKVVKIAGGVTVGSVVVILLLLPTPEQQATNFTEKTDASNPSRTIESDPTQDTWAQLQNSGNQRGNVPTSPEAIAKSYSGSGNGSSRDRNSSMILSRGGLDSKTQLPPGTQIRVKLLQKATVTNQALPVIAIVTADVTHNDDLAIPQGSKLFGEMSFDESTERAMVTWHSIIFPDGHERKISAISTSQDGQSGIDGNIHSEAIKNTIGQTLTRFIGAYAEGSMSHGLLGSSQGGAENGIKNAVSETAKDRAEKMAEDMKKEKKWIEVSDGTPFFGVLNQTFTFRDPGVTYGN